MNRKKWLSDEPPIFEGVESSRSTYLAFIAQTAHLDFNFSC
tara:strand:+ start:475 stop:597 length:123 start_codon:yes stop_codon:yes gene_type:complete